MLGPPKLSFPKLAEDLRHLPLFTPLNPLIEILKRPAHLFGQSAAYTAFAGAHETNQDDCPLAPRSVGSFRLPAKHTHPCGLGRAFRTPFSPIRFALRFSYCFSERFLR
jgi:hypothetical protein